jgi:hypothetical protein
LFLSGIGRGGKQDRQERIVVEGGSHTHFGGLAMKYKDGPYEAMYRKQRMEKHTFKNGGDWIAYYTGAPDYLAYWLWISQEEKLLPREQLLQLAQAWVILES